MSASKTRAADAVLTFDPPTLTKARLSGVETMRVLAMLAVIGLHTPAFSAFTSMDRLEQVTFCLIEQLFTFAVPFFFLASGYFFAIAVRNGKDPWALLQRNAGRFLPLFAVWYGIYALLPFGWPEAFLTHGIIRPLYWQALQTFALIQQNPWTFWLTESWQLWFLPALVIGQTTLALLVGSKNRLGWLGVALMFYAAGTTSQSHALAEVALAILFSVLGFCLSELKKPTVSTAVFLIVLGYIAQVTEAAVLWQLFAVGPKGMPYLLSTIPFALGVFLLSLALAQFGASTPLPNIAALTMGIYLTHNLFTFALPDRIWLAIPIAVWLVCIPVLIYIIAGYLVSVALQYRLTRSLITGEWRRFAPAKTPEVQGETQSLAEHLSAFSQQMTTQPSSMTIKREA